MNFLQKMRGAMKAAKPEDRLAELLEALAALEAARTDLQNTIETSLDKRDEMLAGDASDEAIAKLDISAQRARIRQERLDVAEQEIRDAISSAELKINDGSYREFFTQWQAHADSLIEKTIAASHARSALERFLDQAPAAFAKRVRHPGFAPVDVSTFANHAALVEHKEFERRKAIDGKEAA